MNRLSKIANSLSDSLAVSAPSSTMSENKTAAQASLYGHIQRAPLDPILGTKIKYRQDTDPRKMNLGIGAYRTNEGKPYVLNAVREAEKLLANDVKQDHEYLGIEGDQEYVKAARGLLLGHNTRAVQENRVATVQTLSGTGALRIGFEFVKKFFGDRKVFLSNPTWGNHKTILTTMSIPFGMYAYWDPSTRGLNLNGMLNDIASAPRGSIFLLHACAHNPTGVDPTQAQWRQIADAIRGGGHIAMFDSAYQGFATGDLERDAWAVRYFTDAGLPVFVCQSFAKNFGLYNERAGTFSVVTDTPEKAVDIVSQIKRIIRPMYSNPPAHGARIVKTVLNNPQLRQNWFSEMKMMSDRILKCRHLLVGELKKLGTPGDWSHITSQIGMFSFTGLSVPQCQAMKSKHHVYLLDNGRISMAGVNTNNVAYLARAMDDVVRNVH